MIRTPAILAALVVTACSTKPAQTPPDGAPVGSRAGTTTKTETKTKAKTAPRAPATGPKAPVAIAEKTSPFAEKTRSLKLLRSISVRAEPTEDAERHGTIAAGTRVAWKRTVTNGDCKQRWVEIEPYGWICESYLSESEEEPEGMEVPRLKRDEILPAIYGKVIGEEPKAFEKSGAQMVEKRAIEGSLMVRRYDAVTVGEMEYWRTGNTGQSEYIPTESIREYRPSKYRGLRLGDDTGLDLPIGFPMSWKQVSAKIPIYSQAVGGRRVGRARSRVPTPVLEIARDENGDDVAYRIGENRWIRASEMRIAKKVPPPPLIGKAERWFDLDLGEQVLVAYEGDMPFYVTLVATGSSKHPTATGIYRIWLKFSETDMSDLADEDPYSVATVPWTQFYAKDLALHTAYWHDTFGTRRSHGCTNLAPMDARFLYFWSEPQVPPGWSMAKGTVERPGSLVRIRSKDDPEPEFQGYAAEVQKARQAARGKGKGR